MKCKIKDWAKRHIENLRGLRNDLQVIMLLSAVCGVIASLERLGEHGLAAVISVLFLGVIATGLLVAWVEVEEEKGEDLG